MPQRGDMDAALPEKMLVQLGEVFIHLRELHAGVCRQHHVDGHGILVELSLAGEHLHPLCL